MFLAKATGTSDTKPKSRRSPFAVAMVIALVAGRPQSALAIRPFVTDDARVVGYKLAQFESWVLIDRVVIEHNVLVALGPTEWLELTLGFIHGRGGEGRERGYSITGPIVQGKVLLLPARSDSWPGLAIGAGVLPPLGLGEFTPPGFTGFAFAALTQNLWDEALLLHANLGVALGDDGDDDPVLGFDSPTSGRLRTLVTAGFGLQARIFAGLHGVAEVYHGDPYDPRTNFPATQMGFRYIISEEVQLDGTFGTSLSKVDESAGHAQTQRWGTVGLRLVSPELW